MGNENSAMLVSYLLQISYAVRAEFGAEATHVVLPSARN